MEIFIAAAAEILKFETAALLLVTAGLLILAKIVSDLRAEVRGLRGASAQPEKSLQCPPPSAVAQPRDTVPAGDIPSDVFTAIVSAVYCTLGDNHRIVSVSPVDSLMWSREGRRSIFRSHTFR